MCDRLGDEAADLRAMRCRGEKNMPTEEQRYESLDECLKRVEAERDTLAARVEELEDAVEYGKLVNEKLSDYYVAASGKGDCIFGFPCPRDDQEERIGCATCAAIAAQVEVDAALGLAEACPPDGVAYNPQVAPIAEVGALKAERDKLAAQIKSLVKALEGAGESAKQEAKEAAKWEQVARKLANYLGVMGEQIGLTSPLNREPSVWLELALCQVIMALGLAEACPPDDDEQAADVEWHREAAKRAREEAKKWDAMSKPRQNPHSPIYGEQAEEGGDGR